MKKIMLIFTSFLILLFISHEVLAQNGKIPTGFDDEILKDFKKLDGKWETGFENFKTAKKNRFLNQSVIKTSTLLNSTGCGDSGFESGALNSVDFTYYYGSAAGGFNCSNTTANNMDNPIANSYTLGLISPTTTYEMPYTCMTCSGTPSPSLQIHQRIETVGNDPVVGSVLQKVHSGNYSMRLGNAAVNVGVEKMTKTFLVTTANSNFSFWYALVMGKPSLGDHSTNTIPTFIVQVKDVSIPSSPVLYNTPSVINLSGGLNYVSSIDPILISTFNYTNFCTSPSITTQTTDIAYKPWSYQSINLSSLIGKTVSIEIITRDCAHCGHFTYAYLDDFCSTPNPTNPTGSISLGQSDTCAPGQICVNYTLPITSTAPVVTGSVMLHLNIFQNGILIPPVLNSTILTTGSTYCFPITSSLLATLTANGHFDYSISADFSVSSVSLPSQYIGITGSGQDLLTNNDYAIQCKTPCQCGQWGSTGYTLGNTSNKFNCNGTTNIINANLGDVFSLFPAYTCIGGTVAQACNPTFSYDVYYANGGVLLDVKNIKDQKIDSCGDIRIVMKVKCGNVVCPPCEFILRVNCCQCAQDPKPYLFWTTGSGNAILDKQLDLKCGETYTDKLKCFQPYVIKVQSPCGVNCQPDSIITTIQPPTGPLQVSYSLAGATIIANQVGTYIVTIKVKCGGKWCAPCVIRFIQTQKCEPPCDNCKDKVAFEFDSGASTVVVQTHPTASTLNATLVLGGGADTYTQIRVNVVDFQITSDNPACLQCYNMPNQWGSILGGTVSGFTPSITTYPGVGAANANNNPREIIFSTTTPAAISMGTNLNLSIRVPGVNPISCCCIKVVLYIKITYRNNKCEECTKIVKVGFTECPGGNVDPATGNSGGTATFDPDGGHPQFRLHAPNNEDAQILNRNSILKSKQ